MCWMQWVIKSAMKENFWFWTFCEWRHKWSSFKCFSPTSSGPGPKPLDGSISLKFLLETRVKSKSYETCNITHKKTKPRLKIFYCNGDSKTCQIVRGFEQLFSTNDWRFMWHDNSGSFWISKYQIFVCDRQHNISFCAFCEDMHCFLIYLFQPKLSNYHICLKIHVDIR